MIFSKIIPKKRRTVLIAILAFIVFSQIWIHYNSFSTVSGQSQTSDQIKKSKPLSEFQSSLPQLQYNFKPEPREYTKFRESRRKAIKKSFVHAWTGYKKYALGHDELRPKTAGIRDPFGGWGATLVDSLSTMLVMDLKDEFNNAIPHLEKINFMIDEQVSVFESIIRYLGGFLSAYELSNKQHEILLRKAVELADTLLPAFDTPTGLPPHVWNPARNYTSTHSTLIAEVGTLQLEFFMLSQLTGNPIYAQKAQAITDLLDGMGYEHGVYIKGLFPTSIDFKKGHFVDSITTFGAMGDSVYEYFLKEYLLTEGKYPQYKQLYLNSINGMKQHMLRQVKGFDLLLLPTFDSVSNSARTAMDHLTCFVPGMLAMGAKTFDVEEDMEIAKRLLESCVYMYRTTATGLSPESWYHTTTEAYNPLTFNKTKEELIESRNWWREGNGFVKEKTEEADPEYSIRYELNPPRERPPSLIFGDKRYVLRPETVESLFILYRMTGDQKYQEYGWEIYESIEKWCKTEFAYAVVRSVHVTPLLNETSLNQEDSMESFLLAETFKYLYLLFSPPDVISLDKYIFNTEAHPFIRKNWDWDKTLNSSVI